MTDSRKRRGAETQTAAAKWFQGHGWPYAESAGAGRTGSDITGVPGLAIEVKARRDLDTPRLAPPGPNRQRTSVRRLPPRRHGRRSPSPAGVSSPPSKTSRRCCMLPDTETPMTDHVELDGTTAAWIEAARAATTEIARLTEIKERAIQHVKDTLGDIPEGRINGSPSSPGPGPNPVSASTGKNSKATTAPTSSPPTSSTTSRPGRSRSCR